MKSLVLLCILAILSISCGGSSPVASGGISGTGGVVASGGISGTGGLSKVSGIIEDINIGATQKAKQKPSNFSVKAFNIDDATIEYSVALSGSNYSVDVPQGVNFKINVLSNDNLLLQKSFLSAQTGSETLSSNINTVSHLMSSMLLVTQGGGNILQTSFEAIETELFGKSNVSENEINLSNLSQNSAATAFLPAIHKNLLILESDSSFSLAHLFSNSYSSANIDGVKSQWKSTASKISSSTDASTYISAFVAAQNDSLFQSYSANLTVNSLFDQVQNDDAKPVLTVFSETVELVPGNLFDYTIAKATIADSRGILSYKGSFVSTPSGSYVSDGSLGRRLQFYPASTDVGKSFVYKIVVKAVNGNFSEATINFNISALKMTAVGSHLFSHWKMGATPLLRPIKHGSSVIVVSKQNDNFELESYALSSLVGANQDSVTLQSKVIVYSTPRSLMSSGNDLYLSTSENIIRFNQDSGAIQALGALNHSGADEMLAIGNVIIAYDKQNFSASSFYNDLTNQGLLQGNTLFNNNALVEKYDNLFLFEDNLLFTNGSVIDFYDKNFSFINRSNLSETALFSLPVKGLNQRDIYFFGNTKINHLHSDTTQSLVSSKDYSVGSASTTFFASLGSIHLVFENSSSIAYYNTSGGLQTSLLNDSGLNASNSVSLSPIMSADVNDSKILNQLLILSTNSNPNGWKFLVYVLKK